MVHVKPTEKKEEAFLFPEVQAALNDSTLEKKLKSTGNLILTAGLL